MNRKKVAKRCRIAKRVAHRCLKEMSLSRKAYEASGDIEKIIGEFISQSHGVTDAPQDFFEQVKDQTKSDLGVDNLEDQLDDEEFYKELNKNINEVADEMGLT